MAITDLTLRKNAELRSMTDTYVDASTRALTARWAQAWQELAEEWQAVITVIISRKAAGTPLTPWQITQLNRTQRALSATGAKLRELAAELGPDLDDALRQVVSRTAVLNEEILQSQLPPLNGRVLPSFTRTDQDALEQIIERAMTNVVSASLPISDESLEAVKSSLIRAVPSGWHPNAAAAEMLRRVRGGFSGGLTRALRIARTEMLDAHRAANRAQNAANSTVEAVVWHADLSSRTCPSCIAKHGTEYPPDTPGPYDHQNGRCTFIPKTKSWADLGFPELEEPPSVFQNSQSWLDQNPEDAIAAIGPDRYRMLMDGQISLSDLSHRVENPNWRPSYTATSIIDLRRKAAS